MDAVTLISGEGRFRSLPPVPGAGGDVAATASALHGDVAWVGRRTDHWEGWLGGVPSSEGGPPGRRLVGALEPTGFLEPADTGELRLKARHGSLTSAEMIVPLLGWRAS